MLLAAIRLKKIHAFCNVSDPAKMGEQVNFVRNVALLGYRAHDGSDPATVADQSSAMIFQANRVLPGSDGHDTVN